MAEATNISPSPTPTTSGASLTRADDDVGLVGRDGAEGEVALEPAAPCARTAAVRPSSMRSSIRWATTSASVSEVKVWPRGA